MKPTIWASTFNRIGLISHLRESMGLPGLYSPGNGPTAHEKLADLRAKIRADDRAARGAA